jgi:Plasmid recombination enzyme
MPFAIARIAKLKQGNIASSGMHVARRRATPNADRDKLDRNQTLIHNNDRHLPLHEVVTAKINSTPQQRKIRTDAVYAVEMLLTASPEYFRPQDPSKYGDYLPERVEQWSDATVKWLTKEYGDRIVRAELHLDEATPHIHAHLVPTDENGQLNCKKIFGGRTKMFAFQDSYAEGTKHLGLERGVRDALAHHTTVKDYYSVVNSASNELDINDLSTIQAKAVAYAHMQTEHQELKHRLKLIAEHRDKLAQKLELTQQSLTVQTQINQTLTTPQPSISLTQIACELKLPPEQIEPQIQPVTLVMNTRQIDLQGATEWLTEKFGAAATIQLINDRVLQMVAEQPLKKFIPPQPERDRWSEVKDYLTNTRQLPAKLIERLHDEGLIYASESGKLICLQRDFEERVTGATSIDLNSADCQSVDGSNLTSGWHYFQSPPQGSIDKVVVVDDPLEAMAYATLHPAEETRLFVVGHEGRWMPGDKLNRVEVVVATDVELYNLPRQVEYQLPQSESWSKDLQTYLAEKIVVQEKRREHVEVEQKRERDWGMSM